MFTKFKKPNNKLIQLIETIQDVNDYFRKELESMKRKQAKVDDEKNSKESTCQIWPVRGQ